MKNINGWPWPTQGVAHTTRIFWTYNCRAKTVEQQNLKRWPIRIRPWLHKVQLTPKWYRASTARTFPNMQHLFYHWTVWWSSTIFVKLVDYDKASLTDPYLRGICQDILRAFQVNIVCFLVECHETSRAAFFSAFTVDLVFVDIDEVFPVAWLCDQLKRSGPLSRVLLGDLLSALLMKLAAAECLQESMSNVCTSVLDQAWFT